MHFLEIEACVNDKNAVCYFVRPWQGLNTLAENIDLKRKPFLAGKTETLELKLVLVVTLDCLLKPRWPMWLSDAGVAS